MNRSRVNRNSANRSKRNAANPKGANPKRADQGRTDKTHQTAVVIIPPRKVWEPVQKIRSAHDKQFRRWMPHLTLLYPFAPKGEFTPHFARACRSELGAGAVRADADRVSFVPAWTRKLHGVACTRAHRTPRQTSPDADESPAAIWGIRARLRAVLRPHLSVGQIEGTGKLKRLLDELNGGWEPLRFSVTELSLISRKAPPNDIFQVDRQITLGG